MFQLHVSIYVSIISIDIKGIILFHNFKFISRIDFMELLLVIFTSSINIQVLYLLVLLAIDLQLDICPRFIYN